MTDIANRLNDLRQQISEACSDADRRPEDVHLLAVSKTKPVSDIQAAASQGQQDFGENYLQDAMTKIPACPNVTWHFVGAIQSNKTSQIAAHFDWVHTVSSLKVARRLSEQRSGEQPPLNVLLQVNISAEESKSGLPPEEVRALATSMLDLPMLQLRGLMTIPAASKDEAQQRSAFQQLRNLRDDISSQLSLPEFDQLSMGMSGDFKIAIQEGSTWIRIGTAIFGPRSN